MNLKSYGNFSKLRNDFAHPHSVNLVLKMKV